MKRQVVDCDRCGESALADPVCVSVPVGESKDPVDCRTSTDWSEIDLCASCAGWAFRRASKGMSMADGASLLKAIRECKTAKKKGVIHAAS